MLAPRCRIAAAIEGDWDGHLITLKTPDTSLLNQASPVLFHADVPQGRQDDGQLLGGRNPVRPRAQCG